MDPDSQIAKFPDDPEWVAVWNAEKLRRKQEALATRWLPLWGSAQMFLRQIGPHVYFVQLFEFFGFYLSIQRCEFGAPPAQMLLSEHWCYVNERTRGSAFLEAPEDRRWQRETAYYDCIAASSTRLNEILAWPDETLIALTPTNGIYYHPDPLAPSI